MKRTEISQLGKNAFIERLIKPFGIIPEDAATIDRGDYLELISSSTMLEGVNFDLQYTPLQHLGYKAVVAAISNICAMNGTAECITVSLGISARFSVEEVESIYEGIGFATKEYNLKLIGGNTSASLTGLMLVITAVGRVDKDKVVHRSGAKDSDLICITGNLGSAYMGLKLLEREKIAVGSSGLKPEFKGGEYLLERQLKPKARKDIIERLEEAKIVPTSMIDITSGLASAALNIAYSSQCGLRIYLERLPIASEAFSMAKDLSTDPVVAALNGGDDYELMFTVPLEYHQEILTMESIDVIGHILPESKGAALTTPDGSEIMLQSPDFSSQFETED